MFKKKLKPHFGKLSIILLVVIAVLIAADLLTKHFEELYPGAWNVEIIPGFWVIKSGIRNRGCAFSFLNEHPEIGQPVLITVTFLLLAVMIFAFIFMPNRLVIMKVAISLVIAGAIGNLVDRIAFNWVRDWFGIWLFGGIAYCNFADFWIVFGAVLAVIDLLFLNEYSVFPLTKKAKAAQQARKEEEDRKKAEEEGVAAQIVTTDTISADSANNSEGDLNKQNNADEIPEEKDGNGKE